MANSLTAASPTLWSRTAGYKLYNSVIFKNLSSFKEEAELSFGQKVDRPYRANLAAENYSKGTAATAQDISFTSDQLTINKSDDIHIYLDDIDKIQNKYDTMRLNAEESGIRLGIRMDSNFLYEVKNANDTVDDGDFGGTDGNGLTLTTANIDDLVGKIAEIMDINNVPQNERAMVISPYFWRVLWNRIQGKESILGDKVAENGYMGLYDGFKLYKSNNLTASARWTPADNPSNTATITIQSITFTFVSTIGTTAGNILIGDTTADTLDNLVALINNGGATSDSGVSNVSLSTANQRKVQMWVAVDNTTSVDVYVKGANTLTLATSEENDPWSRQVQHVVALRPKRAIDMVVQKYPKMEFQRAVSNGKWGTFGLMVSLYGLKTFNQGTKELVNVKIDESVM